MKNRQLYKITGTLFITFLLLAAFVTPALAVGVKTDNVMVVSSDVDDDLYAAARYFTLSATVHGDLIVFAQTVTIQPGGVVEGDLMGAGQDIIIQGEVKGDVRIAGGVILVSSTGKVDEDLIAAGYSLELEPGSQVGMPDSQKGGDVAFAGSQASFSGSIAGDIDMIGEGLELNGTVDRNLKIYVGQEKADRLPFGTLPGLRDAQTIPGGLTFGSQAKIGGSLEYTSPEEASIPAAVIAREKVTFHQQEFNWERVQTTRRVSTLNRVAAWGLNQFRWFVSLLLIGLLLAWAAPELTRRSAEHLRAKPLHSLGWGFVSIFALLFGVLSLIVMIGMLGVILGILHLTGLLALEIILGFMALFGLVMVYVTAAVLVSKIIVSYLGGQLILRSIKPEWAKNRIWPLLLGLVIFAILTAIPLYIGQFINLVIILFGLGALWMAGSEWIRRKSSKPEEVS
jgi:cytoskeletal protein CcmA (bactofilin family)